MIDAGVLTLYFSGRPDVKQYFDRIQEGSVVGYMCEINVAEFLYTYGRKFGWDAARVKVNLLRRSKIEFPVMDEEVTEEAARVKFDFPKFSLADCFLTATAIKLGCTVLTNDEELKKCNRVRVIHFS